MKVHFSLYTLTPLKAANRLTAATTKTGIFLKGETDQGETFADYFPHVGLGDRTTETFLQDFSKQLPAYDRKIFYFLNVDRCFQVQKALPFLNHQLWDGTEDIESPIIKYKLKNTKDTSFLEALFKGIQVRLDANGLSTRPELEEFLKLIPPHLMSLISYVEDPMASTDWSNLTVPTAADFIGGTPHDVVIYKPNRGFLPETKLPKIFSSYLGSDLGRWHAYCEMVNYGDLHTTHGIVTKAYYQEEKDLFRGHYLETFSPDLTVVHSIYDELRRKPWTYLCTI